MENPNITIKQIYDAQQLCNTKVFEALVQFKLSTGLNVSSIGIIMIDPISKEHLPKVVDIKCVVEI